MAYDDTVAIVTLAGSLLSCVSSVGVLICFVVYRQSRQSFRHALVFNLALADFINATNNSISGIIYVRDHGLAAGKACAFNGWLGQLSVQATDFSVLAISLITLVVVTWSTRITDASTLTKTMLCLSVWIMPLITSTTALAMGVMVPVSGNWCWISASRTDLRYALGHGWRFAIMGITIITYTYIWWYITRHFKSLKHISLNTTVPTGSNNNNEQESQLTNSSSRGSTWKRKRSMSIAAAPITSSSCDDENSIDLPPYPAGSAISSAPPQHQKLEFARSSYFSEDPEQGSSSDQDNTITYLAAPAKCHHNNHYGMTAAGSHFPSIPLTKQEELEAAAEAASGYETSTTVTSKDRDPEHPQHVHINNANANNAGVNRINTGLTDQFAARSRKVERSIKKMLLLNGYPIAYVILWIPGIVNRIGEASGAYENKAMAVLQASTQFIGFANAVTYGLNQQWRGR